MGAKFSKIAALFFLGFSSAAHSSSSTTVILPFVCDSYPCPPPAKWPLFDDRVFDLESKSVPPPVTSTGASGNTRYLGRDRDYNYVQREAWIKQCSPLRNDSMASFRDCFETERTKAAGERERRQDEIIRDRNQPFRNAPPREELGRAKGRKKLLLSRKTKRSRR